MQHDEETPSGADNVRDAIEEFGSVSDGTREAVLGEPQIEESQSRYTTDPKIVVPVEGTKYGSAGTLVFDIPLGVNDENAKFWRLLNIFDLSLDQLEQLEGQEVPVQYSGGNIIVMWDQVGEEE